MSKLDITVGRSMTINTGNFSSIKPSVSITLKDVEAEQVDDAYGALTEIVSSVTQLEIADNWNQMRDAQVDIREYVDDVIGQIEEIGQNLDNNLKILIDLG